MFINDGVDWLAPAKSQKYIHLIVTRVKTRTLVGSPDNRRRFYNVAFKWSLLIISIVVPASRMLGCKKSHGADYCTKKHGYYLPFNGFYRGGCFYARR